MANDMCCENCRFWVANSSPDEGDCRKNPPVIVGEGEHGVIIANSHWPITAYEDWCGAHKPKDAKPNF